MIPSLCFARMHNKSLYSKYIITYIYLQRERERERERESERESDNVKLLRDFKVQLSAHIYLYLPTSLDLFCELQIENNVVARVWRRDVPIDDSWARFI